MSAPHAPLPFEANLQRSEDLWDSQVSPAVSEPTSYGFTDRNQGPDEIGIPGGVGGGAGYASGVIIYIGVPDVEAALAKAVRLGGTRVMGPENNPGKGIMFGHFKDPQGNLVGVAGPK